MMKNKIKKFALGAAALAAAIANERALHRRLSFPRPDPLPPGGGRGEGETSHLEIGCRMNETALP